MSNNTKSPVKTTQHVLLKDVTVGSGKDAKVHKKGSKIALPESALTIWRRKYRIE